MSLRELAAQVAEAGRGGDKHILHITDDELQALVQSGLVTINPETGMPEAFKLKSLLSIALPIAAAIFAPQLLSAFAPEAAAAGAATGIAEGVGAAEGLGLAEVSGLPSVELGTGVAAGGLMPAAVPETAASLASQGLVETAPGVFAQPALDAITGSGGVSGFLKDVGTNALTSGFRALTGDESTSGLKLPTLSDAVSPTGLKAGGVSTPTIMGGPSAAGGSSITDFLKENKNLILPGAIMAASALNTPTIPQIPNLEAVAGKFASGAQPAADAAKALIPSLATGVLPPGAQTKIQNAVQDAVTSIKSKYAQMGMSGSTPEAQEISAAKARGEALSFDLADQLTKTGLSAAGIAAAENMDAAQVYSLIMNAQLQSDEQLRMALANFASASALGSALGGK